MILLPLIIVGCKTTKEVEKEITLPPRPQRMEHKPVCSIKEAAEVIKYYEYLLQEWENYGDIVERTVYQN